MLNKIKINKNKIKIKSLNLKKNVVEIWWIGTFPRNLALIHSVVFEKTMPTDDGRSRDNGSYSTKQS